MRAIQTRLLQENPQFRRLWVQYSHHRTYRVVITLFPQGNAPYEMAFGEPQDLTYESINNILQNYLQNRN
jgi:hypothetical protein